MTVFTIPNILTFARIVIIPVFVMILYYKQYQYALILFAIAAITDLLDGLLARMIGQKTKLGAFLDPLADKFLLLTSFVLFAVYGWLPNWITITVISRDAIVVLGWVILVIFTRNNRIEPSVLGKMANASQAILIAFILVFINFEIEYAMFIKQQILLVVAALTVFSGIQYIYKGVRAVL